MLRASSCLKVLICPLSCFGIRKNYFAHAIQALLLAFAAAMRSLVWKASPPTNHMPIGAFLRSGIHSVPVALVPTCGGFIRVNNPKVIQEELRKATPKGHRSRLFRVPGAQKPQGNVGGDADSNQAAALLYGGGDLPPAVAEDPPGSPSPLRLWLRCRRLRRPCGCYSAGYTTCLRPVPVRERARRPGRRRHSGDRRRPHSINLRMQVDAGNATTTPTFPTVSACMGHWGSWHAWVATLAARGLTWLLLYFLASEIYREQQPGIPQTAEVIYGWCCRIVAYADPVASTALASLPVFGPYEYAEAHAVLAAVVMVVTLCVLAAATYLKVMVENDDGTPQYYTTISSIINYGDAAKYFFTAFILHTLTHGRHLINIMATVLQWPLPQKQLQSIWRRILMMTSAVVETVSLPLIAVYRSEQTQEHLSITAVYAMTSLATMSLFFIEQRAVQEPIQGPGTAV
nr:uncharacterized protein LOC126517603 [Dermacentor andersoni]